jgi:hypothetical protein
MPYPVENGGGHLDHVQHREAPAAEGAQAPSLGEGPPGGVGDVDGDGDVAEGGGHGRLRSHGWHVEPHARPAGLGAALV